MKWTECGRCGKVYPESRKNSFFRRCGECRASLDHYDWTIGDMIVVATFFVVIAAIVGGVSWWVLVW